MTQWTDKHYDFTYTLTEKDIEKGSIKLDPYFVAKQWKTGSKDDSGALFHVLKTVARFGDKNDIEREVKALHAQVLGVARGFGVELEFPKGDSSHTLSVSGQLNLVNILASENVHQGIDADPWYPDDSGEWKETSSVAFETAKALLQDCHIEILVDHERDEKKYRKTTHNFRGWFGENITGWDNCVAYKNVE